MLYDYVLYDTYYYIKHSHKQIATWSLFSFYAYYFSPARYQKQKFAQIKQQNKLSMGYQFIGHGTLNSINEWDYYIEKPHFWYRGVASGLTISYL